MNKKYLKEKKTSYPLEKRSTFYDKLTDIN